MDTGDDPITDEKLDAWADEILGQAWPGGKPPSAKVYAAVSQMLNDAATRPEEQWWTELPSFVHEEATGPAEPPQPPVSEARRKQDRAEAMTDRLESALQRDTASAPKPVYMKERPAYDATRKRWIAPVAGGGQWEDPTQEGPK